MHVVKAARPEAGVGAESALGPGGAWAFGYLLSGAWRRGGVLQRRVADRRAAGLDRVGRHSDDAVIRGEKRLVLDAERRPLSREGAEGTDDERAGARVHARLHARPTGALDRAGVRSALEGRRAGFGGALAEPRRLRDRSPRAVPRRKRWPDPFAGVLLPSNRGDQERGQAQASGPQAENLAVGMDEHCRRRGDQEDCQLQAAQARQRVPMGC